MQTGATNKRKGSNAERLFVKLFRELGFTECCTSRLASRKHDNAKIDLMFLPFNVQVKAGMQKNMNPGKELLILKSAVQEMFEESDPVQSKPCILIHYKQGVPGVKREEDSMIVYMSEFQFNSFRNVTDLHLPLCYYRTVNFETKSEFKTIVGMTFKDFSKFVQKLYPKNADNSESTTNSGVL